MPSRYGLPRCRQTLTVRLGRGASCLKQRGLWQLILHLGVTKAGSRDGVELTIAG